MGPRGTVIGGVDGTVEPLPRSAFDLCFAGACPPRPPFPRSSTLARQVRIAAPSNAVPALEALRGCLRSTRWSRRSTTAVESNTCLAPELDERDVRNFRKNTERCGDVVLQGPLVLQGPDVPLSTLFSTLVRYSKLHYLPHAECVE